MVPRSSRSSMSVAMVARNGTRSSPIRSTTSMARRIGGRSARSSIGWSPGRRPPDVLAAFIAGALAGYAIAIPVGAIAVLIVETGVRRGFRVGAAAGAGAATADLVYATLAMAGGTAIAPALAPWSVPLRVAAIAFLLYLGLRGLIRIARDRRAAATSGGPDGPAAASQPDGPGAIATYARFVGLTLLNPSTVASFTALVLALPSLGRSPLAQPASVPA